MLTALRQQIADLLDPPPVDASVVSTGIPALDAVLSGGGLPLGRLTEVIGTRGSGKTTVVRELVVGAIAARRWVAYVDASRTLAPRDWAAAADSGLLWIVRPTRAERGAWCTDVLLRSGAFGLVVLDGAPALSREVAIRLTRLARDSHAAFVLVQDDEERQRGHIAGSALRLQVAEKHQRRGRHGTGGVSRVVTVNVEKGSRSSTRSVEVSCVIDVARRLCAHPEVPDRRGVAKRNRRGERAGSDVIGARRPTGDGSRNSTDSSGSGAPHDSSVPTGSTLAHKRRCAEPAIHRDAFLLPEPAGHRRPKGRGGRGVGRTAAGAR